MNLRSPALALCTAAAVAVSGCGRAVERVFEVSSDGASRTGVALTPRGLLLGNEAGVLMLVSPEGQIRWKAHLGREIASRPLAVGGTAVAVTVSGDWVGVDLETGAGRWRVPDQPPVTAPLATDGARVLAVTRAGSVRAADPATGELLWFRTPPPGAERASRTFSAPVVQQGTAVYALEDAGVLAVATEGGALQWRVPLQGAAAVLGDGASEGQLFAIGREGTLLSLSRDGEVRWRRELRSAFSGAAALVPGGIAVALEGRIALLDRSRGDELWSAPVEAPAGPACWAAGLLLVPTSGLDGALLAFALPSQKPYARIRLDSPLRAAPRVLENGVVAVPASDGRLIGLRLHPPERLRPE